MIVVEKYPSIAVASEWVVQEHPSAVFTSVPDMTEYLGDISASIVQVGAFW